MAFLGTVGACTAVGVLSGWGVGVRSNEVAADQADRLARCEKFIAQQAGKTVITVGEMPSSAVEDCGFGERIRQAIERYTNEPTSDTHGDQSSRVGALLPPDQADMSIQLPTPKIVHEQWRVAYEKSQQVPTTETFGLGFVGVSVGGVAGLFLANAGLLLHDVQAMEAAIAAQKARESTD